MATAGIVGSGLCIHELELLRGLGCRALGILGQFGQCDTPQRSGLRA